MLEDYQKLLQGLRDNPRRWPELAYAPEPHPEWTRVDANATRRLGVLVCLQYDRRPEDHSLVRYLFEQEVSAREDDPFQGESAALDLGAFLLAGYRRGVDVPLMWRAKQANFDTWCGFDTHYLLAADRDAGLQFIASLPHDDVESITEILGKAPAAIEPEELEEWWRVKQEEYPEREQDEDLLVLVQRAITLGATEEGRRWLDRWEAAQPGDAPSLSTLMYLRDALGQPEEALQAARKLRDLARGNAWNYASSLRELSKYLVRLQRHQEAWDVLQELRGLLMQHRDWLERGLARMVVEEFFDLAAQDECPDPIRRAAWEQGHDLIICGVQASLVVLRKAAKLAGLVGARALEEQYTAQADREHERIYGEHDQQ